jgi:hypothetical protein
MKRIALLLSAAFAMASAVASPAPDSSSLNFQYTATNREGVGLVRAFDNGSKTVLQFQNLSSIRPTIVRRDGTPIAYKSLGDYAVLPTIYDNVRVYVAGQISDVRSYGGADVDPTTGTPDFDSVYSPTAQPEASRQTRPAYVPRTAFVAVQQTAPAAQDEAPVPYPHTYAVGTNPTPLIERTPSVAASSAPTPASPAAAAVRAPITTTSPAVIKPTPAVITRATTTASPVVASSAEPVWRAPAGSTLRAVLKLWATRAGWQEPSWESPKLDAIDYPLPSDMTFNGSFEHVVEVLMRPYSHADTPIKADLFVTQRQIHISEKN